MSRIIFQFLYNYYISLDRFSTYTYTRITPSGRVTQPLPVPVLVGMGMGMDGSGTTGLRQRCPLTVIVVVLVLFGIVRSTPAICPTSSGS